ncbi:MAG: hypothetical protein KKD01_01245 [Proteobacteria bacterium]|nr:hypothetical protein [Pseudomonadota bacterium]MBU1418271.1 hypothetical protein [Pseudomonadota bacterium]MBU1453325.1 hypothetical protein [Pseudomonadota bacterium]
MSQNNVKVKDLADMFGLKLPSISAVIHGKRSTKYIQQAIADAIKMPVSNVFPDAK